MRLCIDAFAGTVMGKVSPATFLTKICIVSESSGDWDRELETGESILVRMVKSSGVFESI